MKVVVTADTKYKRSQDTTMDNYMSTNGTT